MEKIKIDTQLFLDIISSEEGVDFEFQDEQEGFIFKYYTGKNGYVAIRVDAEFIYNTTARAYMRQLGLDELILRLFPSDS